MRQGGMRQTTENRGTAMVAKGRTWSRPDQGLPPRSGPYQSRFTGAIMASAPPTVSPPGTFPRICKAWFGDKPCIRHTLAKGLCPTHWSRQRKGLDLNAPLLRITTCTARWGNDPCTRKTKHETGLCFVHRKRLKKGTPLNAPHGRQKSFCSAAIGGGQYCGRPVRGSGLCSGHYARLRKDKPVDGPLRKMRGHGEGAIDKKRISRARRADGTPSGHGKALGTQAVARGNCSPQEWCEAR